MKYHVTSAEAAKLLKKLLDEKSILLADEYRSSTFNAALGEDVESVRPVYDYAVTQQALEHCNRKIRLLKHAINCFNTTQLVGDTGMTIDQVLVYIPQLTEMRSRLYTLQDRLPKQPDLGGGHWQQHRDRLLLCQLPGGTGQGGLHTDFGRAEKPSDRPGPGQHNRSDGI